MRTTTTVGLLALGGIASAATYFLLRKRPRKLRLLASGVVLALPLTAYATFRKPTTRFIFITDTHGSALANAKLVKALLNEDADFIVHGGDIVDTEDLWSTWWDTPFRQITDRWPVYPTLGNHDPEMGYRNRFGLERFPPYVLHMRGVDLFFIPFSLSASVGEWLNRETVASTAPVKILVTHRPLWAAHGSQSRLPQILASSLPRLDLVLAGHNHVSWDTTVNGLRQIIEVSGPKKYTCNTDAVGCVEGETGFVRVNVYPDGSIRTERVVVP